MKPLLLIFSLLFSMIADAQVKISGTVKSGKGKALPGVSITLKDTYDGATSDAEGAFAFTTSETGSHVIVASIIGFKEAEQPVTIGTQALSINIEMKEEITELKAVVISAGAFEAGDRKKGTVLNSIDIVTTASANADVTGALKTLPGAQQVGESEGLFVRGGTAAETKTFIDGTLVNNFFFSSVPNVAQRGRFSPFIFKGTVFSTGGYSALYGQALSSALILESIDLPEESSANLGITAIGLSGGFQQLAKKKKSSWGINYAYTDLTPAFKVIKQQQDFFNVPRYHNVDANFRIKTSATGMLKYYGYFNSNKLGFTINSLDTAGFNDLFRLTNLNTYHNLSYRDVLGKGWKLNAGLSYTYNRDSVFSSLADAGQKTIAVPGLEYKQFGINTRSTFVNGRVVMEKTLRGLSAVRFGTEYNYSDEQPDFTLYNGFKVENKIEEHLNAVFGEADVYLTNNMAAKVGARAERSALLQHTNIAPRLSLAYKLGNQGQASLAYGTFYQTPETRYLNGPATNLIFMKARHYIAQYQRMANDRTLRLELFYKDYDHLLKTALQGNRDIAVNTNGYGYAKGFEAFWRDKKTVRNLDYWISYSYLDTERDFLNYPFAIQPNFAAKHTASVVVKRFVTQWKTGFNAAYNFSSPRPYFFIAPDNSGTKFLDRGETPPYHNVSFSLNYLPKLGKGGAESFTVLVLSVSNIFGFDQEFGRRYSFTGQRFETITPPSRRFIFIGAFISFGVDRSQDIINSNL